MTDYSGQIKTTKKGYSLTTDETSGETVDIDAFVPEKKKKITVNLNNGGSNYYHSSYFNETITNHNGSFDMYLYGYGSKNVNLGSTSGNQVRFMNSGKNTATAGNGGNKFYCNNINGKNTITAGTGVDNYFLTDGTNKITDKGGNNTYEIYDFHSNNTIISGTGNDTYTILRGYNNITDKGGDNTFNLENASYYYGKYITGSGSDTFNITVSSAFGDLKINSGAGADKLYIHNKTDIRFVTKITADLGKGNDIVEIDHQGAGKDVTFNNIKTGVGSDTVTISAGIENFIDTGKDIDTITINGGINNYITSGDGANTVTISAGYNNRILTGNSVDTITVQSRATASTITTIKAGKANDIIEVNAGKNYIYGETGKDEVKLKNGNNIAYGGNDIITATGGSNTIFANADRITLSNGTNTVNTKKGKNTIEVIGGSGNTINLSKGNNTVNALGTGTRATINIATGKNTVIVKDTSVVGITSTAKTTQTIEIKDSAFCGVTLGKGNDVIKNSSDTNETNSIKAGAGNDKIYISAGRKKVYGESGNDYIELSGGSGHSVDGGSGKDTFDIKGAGSSNINGGLGKDTFNIITGNGNNIYGDEGNDIFNINGGFSNWIYGDEGDDIYNLNSKQIGQTSILSDSAGKNRVNVSKNYNAYSYIHDFAGSNDTLSFDKSYKLTNKNNVKADGSLNTNNSSLTIYLNYAADSQTFDTGDTRLIKNLKDEMSDNALDDHMVSFDSTIEKFSFGGKNYRLNLDSLKQSLISWFTAHSAYADKSADYVLENGSDPDIQSLMAVYTKDTASCFVQTK